MSIGGGKLGGIELTTTTWKTIYKPASGVIATVSVRFCNRAAAVRTIRLASSQSASADPTPGDGDCLVYSTVLQAAGDPLDRDKFEYAGIVLNGTSLDQIVAYCDGVDVDCLVHGVTET